MRNLNKLVWGLSMTCLVACSKNRADSTAASTTQASLVMTGSAASSASVAMAPSIFERILRPIVPTANALAAPSLVDSNGVAVTLLDAWIVIKEVKFEVDETKGAAESENESSEEIKFKGPYYVDLLSAAPSALDQQTIPAQSYKRIKMKLEHEGTLPAAAPAELAGYSIYLRAMVNGHVLTYQARDGSEFKISGPSGVTPTDGKDILAVVRLPDLFSKISLASVVADTAVSDSNKVSASNPCPTIDSQAQDLFKCFREGLESETDFGRDDNGDHELGHTDERAK